MKTVILYFIIYLALLNTSLEKLGSTVSDKINDYVTQDSCNMQNGSAEYLSLLDVVSCLQQNNVTFTILTYFLQLNQYYILDTSIGDVIDNPENIDFLTMYSGWQYFYDFFVTF